MEFVTNSARDFASRSAWSTSWWEIMRDRTRPMGTNAARLAAANRHSSLRAASRVLFSERMSSVVMSTDRRFCLNALGGEGTNADQGRAPGRWGGVAPGRRADPRRTDRRRGYLAGRGG